MIKFIGNIGGDGNVQFGILKDSKSVGWIAKLQGNDKFTLSLKGFNPTQHNTADQARQAAIELLK